MCNDIGISRGFLTDLKMGRKQSATAETIRKIAEYFGVSADDVLYGTKKDPAETSEADSETMELLEELRDNSDMRMLLHSAKHATPEQIRAVAEMLMKFKGES